MDKSSSHRLGHINAQSSVPLSASSTNSQPIPPAVPSIVVQTTGLDEKAQYSPLSADAVRSLREELEILSPHRQHSRATYPQLHSDATASRPRPHQLRVPAPPSLTASPVIPSSWTAPTPTYSRPRGLRIANLLKPWIPIILYALTSLAFLVGVSFWKVEVFEGMSFNQPISISRCFAA